MDRQGRTLAQRAAKSGRTIRCGGIPHARGMFNVHYSEGAPSEPTEYAHRLRELPC